MFKFAVSLFSFVALSILASTAHAGFEFGVICEDSTGAQYVFSDAIVRGAGGEDGIKNPTVCLKGVCNKNLMKIAGVTEDDGIIYAGKSLKSSRINDPAFVEKYGEDGEIRAFSIGGAELICSARKLLSEISGD